MLEVIPFSNRKVMHSSNVKVYSTQPVLNISRTRKDMRKLSITYGKNFEG
jgi:hypothetical protein